MGPAADRVADAARDLVRALRATGPRDALPGVKREVNALAGTTCVLRGRYEATLLGGPGIVVSIEYAGGLPVPACLEGYQGLTPREAEVAALIARGLADRAIADELSISVNTSRRHTADVLKKLELSSRAGVALALMNA